MKTLKQLFSFSALAVTAFTSAFAQAPANDNFANRIVLSGSSVTFSGSLAGATLEAAETNGTFPTALGASGSIWWTWTAPVSGTVVISMTSPQPTFNTLSIFTGTNLTALTSYAFTYFAKPIGRYLRFDVFAGTLYQIQLVGSDTQSLSFKLIATNPPVFIAQPKDCTVSPFGSAFFSAIATGPSSSRFSPKQGTSYQWYFNGTPIIGQTFPSLLIHGITTNQAGTYAVTASNIGGITQGGSAILTVVDTNPAPRVTILPPPDQGSVSLSFSGEPGRWYRIESSTNLSNWSNAWSSASYVLLTNQTATVTVPRLGPTHFVRVSLDVPTEVCVGQLRQLQWGVNLFAIENLKSADSTYTFEDTAAYAPLNSSGQLNPCPEDGTYATGGTVLDAPTCTLHARGHVIPEL